MMHVQMIASGYFNGYNLCRTPRRVVAERGDTFYVIEYPDFGVLQAPDLCPRCRAEIEHMQAEIDAEERGNLTPTWYVVLRRGDRLIIADDEREPGDKIEYTGQRYTDCQRWQAEHTPWGQHIISCL